MTLKIASLVAAAAAALASSAGAQTIVDLVGSSAGRSAVHNNIVSLLGGNANVTYAYDGTSGQPTRATRAIYRGTYNGNSYIIRTYWEGSVNGVRDVQQQIQQTELIDLSVTGSLGGVFVASPTKAPASAETTPEIGFSDVFGTSTRFTAPTTEDEVAIIPFKWYRNVGSDAGVTNMTPLLVQQLFGSLGELPVSMWTGNADDQGITVFGIGRNDQSGTRITAMAESGYSVFREVSQYTTVVDTGTITSLTFAGNGGFSSGSNIKSSVESTYSGGTVVGYLGASDWSTIAPELTWNGVAYSQQNLYQGKYTFWGYLHMNTMLNTSSTSNLQSVFFNALNTAIKAAPGSGLEPVGLMQVARDSDGGPVYPTF